MHDIFYYDYLDSRDIKDVIPKVSSARTDYAWLVLNGVDTAGFDFHFVPNKYEQDQVHAWPVGSNPNHYGIYLVPVDVRLMGMTYDFNYHTNVYPLKDPVATGWKWHWSRVIDDSAIDYQWLPDSWDTEYSRHQFSMAGTEQLSYVELIHQGLGNSIHDIKHHKSNFKFAKSIPRVKNINEMPYNHAWVWVIDENIDYTDFNFDWLPDRWDAHNEHGFAMAGTEQLAYTWLYNLDIHMGKSVQYHKTDLKFKDIKKVNSVDDIVWGKDEFVWVIDSRIDYSNFDFNWLPDTWDKRKVHAFAMQGTEQLAYTFLYNTKQRDLETVYHTSDLQFVQRYVKTWRDDLRVSLSQKILQDPPEHEWTWYTDERINYDGFDFSWLPDAWDKNKVHAFCMKNAEQLSYTWLVHNSCDLDNLKFKYHASELEFNDGVVPVVFWPKFNSVHLESDNWQENLRIVASKLAFGSEWIWICDERIDYDIFDFDWLPPAWDADFIHCFTVRGRERLSYTWLVRADNLHKDARYKYHHTDLMLQNHYDVIELDMLMDGVKSQYKQQRYLGTMEDALKTAARKTDQEWLWVLSNCCDYTDFNLDYLPELDEVEHTHCWPSGIQQKGDTFLIHIPTYLQTNKFKFNFDHKELTRKPWPIVEYTNDSLAEAIKQNPSRSIYTLYKHKDSSVFRVVDVCLWEKRSVVALNKSHSTCLVPRDCVVKKEIYEYPYLEMATVFATEPRIDVIFISNGESQAERNWQKCKKVFGHAQRVDGVNGRLASYQTAAKLSSTDWFIAVFAKCRILDVYDNIGFGWQPDYWQQSKHYIFLNKNLETELIYGHMAPIAYNKKLMLENTGGLDMTLVQQHVVVPITISETDLSDDPWLAWRTAFREVVKLNYYANGELSVEGEYRLWAWQTKGSEWSQRGAIDAMNYIREHGLTEEAVMPTVEWAWLEQYFKKIYSADITEVITRSTSLSDK